jgi:hypothetical protein
VPLIDDSPSKPTLNVSNPDLVPTAEQVLELGKSGLIGYMEMATYWGRGMPIQEDVPLVADYFNLDEMVGDPSLYGIVTFPAGDAGMPISYRTNSSFIFSHAAFPEACYAWLRELSRHPELYEGMPAYHSVIESPTLEAVYGKTDAETFKFFAEMMDAPSALFIRPNGLEPGENIFLARAFDRYVLEDGDLAVELPLAAELIEAYRVCYDPQYDPVDCLLKTDPTIRDEIPNSLLGGR